MKTLRWITGLGLAAAMMIAAPASAQTITSLSPTKVAAGNVQNITIFGSGIGSASDLIDFPGDNDVNPDSWGAGWVRVSVPATWSGSLRVRSGGTWSNTLSFEVSYNWAENQWNAADQPVEWWMHQNGAPGCTVTDTQNALIRGYDAWECASGVSTTYRGTTATLGNSRNDGVNVQIWTTSGWSPGTIAVCSWKYWTASGDIAEFDINYNAQHFNWSCSGEAGKMDVGNIGTHEMGHSLGFLDMYGTADFNDTMYGVGANGETLRRSLSLDDVVGAEMVYTHAGRANLRSWTPSGWTFPIVPRTSNDATATSAILSLTLNGNATNYMNIAAANQGDDCATPSANNTFWLDDQAYPGFWWSGVLGPGYVSGLWRNWGLHVKGGRHTLQIDYDSDNEIVESNEADNTYRHQFVFSPYVLSDLAPVTRSAPPEEGVFANPNSDGFEFTGDWWGAFGVLPAASNDDYDAYLYGDYAGALSGFSTVLETSFTGQGGSDFVLVNGNQVGHGVTRFGGLVRYTANTESNARVEQSNPVGSTLTPSDVYGAEVSSGTISMGSSNVLRVHEVYLSDPALNYRFTLDNLTGTANLNMSLYDAAGDYFGKWDYEVASLGAGADEFFEFQPPTAGYYAVVVWKNNSDDDGKANTYQLRVGKALSNLLAEAPGGYHGPVVPRNAPDAEILSALLPATLDGNASNWFNWSMRQAGPYDTPGWTTNLYLDDVYQTGDTWAGPRSPAFHVALNRGPYPVRGGRHTLRLAVDSADDVEESDESDNGYLEQFVWSPLVTAKNVPNPRSVPPTQGTGIHPNSDGLAFTPAASHSWVVGMAPREPGDDYDLEVYDDYSGSQSGFSNQRGASYTGGNGTEFVVGHFSAGMANVYTGVTRWSATEAKDCTVDQSDTQGRRGFSTASFSATLPSGRVVDVYEALLQSGKTYAFRLVRTGGNDDLQMAVYPSGGVRSRWDALATSTAATVDLDVITFTATADSWFPIAVFRPTGTNQDEPVDYELNWFEGTVTSIPTELPTRFSFRGGYPNPSPGQTRLEFSLPSPGPVKISVHDVRGRRVATVVSETMTPGRHQVQWNGRDDRGQSVASGAYWVRLEAVGEAKTKRITILR